MSGHLAGHGVAPAAPGGDRTRQVVLEFVDSPSVSLDELWAHEDMGGVFMCGYPYTLRADRPDLLAAPVPFPARCGGTAGYVTDFIVRAGRSPSAA